MQRPQQVGLLQRNILIIQIELPNATRRSSILFREIDRFVRDAIQCPFCVIFLTMDKTTLSKYNWLHFNCETCLSKSLPCYSKLFSLQKVYANWNGFDKYIYV